MTDVSAKLRSRCIQVYILYIAAVILSLVPNFNVALLALIIGIIGIVMAYKSRKITEGTVFSSHIRWLIRTFWIGGAVLLPVTTVIFSFIVWKWGDMSAIVRLSEEIMSSGAFTQDQIDETAMQYMRDNVRLFMLAGLPTLGIATLWWLFRSFKGLNLVHEDKPIINPEAFL